MPSTTSSPGLADGLDPELCGDFVNALGHTFDNLAMLELALTHRSFCAENEGFESNERLEFLGDAVLGLVITDALFRNEPEQAEGELAKARAEVVSALSLADLARELKIGPLLRLGRGEQISNGHDKDSILADAMEAVIGAVYLDSGWTAVSAILERLLGGAVARAQVVPGLHDYKTRLQELAAEHGHDAPTYLVSSSGPDHGRMFKATVTVGSMRGSGTGTSKKQAQQNAAEQAIDAVETVGVKDSVSSESMNRDVINVGEGAK